MRVLAVTSWGGACGIANYAEMLKDALAQVAPDIVLEPFAEALDPAWGIPNAALYDVVWLNHHRGLHSRWTPEVVHRVRQQGTPFVITMHDTYGERPPDDLTQQLHDIADAFVVHEPCEGLPKQVLIRQGVPAARAVTHLRGAGVGDFGVYSPTWLAYPQQPILGTCGFNFPWKNFDRLAEVTAGAGWALLILSNNATDADSQRWSTLNPYTLCMGGFLSTQVMVSYLAGCDATCFAYECANSGTSGAIRLGLAARKPVLAFNDTRQFRDLWEDPDSAETIRWCAMKTLKYNLRTIPLQRVDPGIAYLAHRDSWTNQAKKYAAVFKGLS